MSARNRPNKRDTNEPGIVAALRAAGASVERLSTPGVPDLLVGYHGQNLLLEVKHPGKLKLTYLQEEFSEGWRGQMAVVTTPAEALAILKPPCEPSS